MKISVVSIMLCGIVLHAALCGAYTYEAVVSVPVADLIGQPFCDKSSAEHNNQKYETIPFDGKASAHCCSRLHQLLLHERVTVIEQKGDEVCVLVPQIFFITHASKEKQTGYWTLKKNITPMSYLKKQKVDSACLPQPVAFEKAAVVHHPNIISLAYPYASEELGVTLSAGTRFVPTGKTDHESIELYALNPQTIKLTTIWVPKQLCIEHKERSRQAHVDLYVQILKLWAHQEDGFIPYVWGGCSFGTLHKSDNFSYQEKKLNNRELYWFERPTTPPGPKFGVDCAGLVVRAAQIAGIPYFYKNTTTLAHFLQPITDIRQLHNGDLIWIPGHVMVVSDVQKNLIIEARCYKHGFGKVHEIKLKNIFKGITTFAQLLQAIQKREPLQRLHKNGTVVQTVKESKLLSIASAWEFVSESNL